MMDKGLSGKLSYTWTGLVFTRPELLCVLKLQWTLVISNTDISKYHLISKNIVGDISYFLYISALDISNYWYPKVNFLGPENLL